MRESEHGVNSPFTKAFNCCVRSSSNFYVRLSCFSFVQSLLPWMWAFLNSGKRIFKWWPHTHDWSESSVSNSKRWRAEKWTESKNWSREGGIIFSQQTQGSMCPEVAWRSSGKAVYLILAYHCFIVSHLDSSAFLQNILTRKGCSKKPQFHCIVEQGFRASSII